MGTQEITGDLEATNSCSFITRLLHALQALEAMIGQGAVVIRKQIVNLGHAHLGMKVL